MAINLLLIINFELDVNQASGRSVICCHYVRELQYTASLKLDPQQNL
jgi:hypothetical protein